MNIDINDRAVTRYGCGGMYGAFAMHSKGRPCGRAVRPLSAAHGRNVVTIAGLSV